MAKKKGAGSASIPMIGSKAGKSVAQPIGGIANLNTGAKAGKVKASRGGKTKLKQGGNTSSVVNPPAGGGY